MRGRSVDGIKRPNLTPYRTTCFPGSDGDWSVVVLRGIRGKVRQPNQSETSMTRYHETGGASSELEIPKTLAIIVAGIKTTCSPQHDGGAPKASQRPRARAATQYRLSCCPYFPGPRRPGPLPRRHHVNPRSGLYRSQYPRESHSRWSRLPLRREVRECRQCLQYTSRDHSASFQWPSLHTSISTKTRHWAGRR